MNLDFSYDAYQFFTVQLPGVASGGQQGTQFNFPDLPYLRPNKANMVALEIYTVNSVSVFPGTKSNVTAAIMAKSFLTLYGGVPGVKFGNEIIQQVPMYRLNNLQNATPDPFSRSIFLLNEMEVDWTKSFISLGSAPANTGDLYYGFGGYFNFKSTQLGN